MATPYFRVTEMTTFSVIIANNVARSLQVSSVVLRISYRNTRLLVSESTVTDTGFVGESHETADY